MTSNMAEQQMKVLEAVYTQSTFYQVPKDWDVKDVFIKWGIVFYKGEKVDDLKECQGNDDYKMPTNIVDCGDEMDYIFEDE